MRITDPDIRSASLLPPANSASPINSVIKSLGALHRVHETLVSKFQ
jgi:hypothetical protein